MRHCKKKKKIEDARFTRFRKHSRVIKLKTTITGSDDKTEMNEGTKSSFTQCYKLSILSRFTLYSLPTKLLYNIRLYCATNNFRLSFHEAPSTRSNHSGSISLALFHTVFEISRSTYLSYTLFLFLYISLNTTPFLLYAIIDNEIETRYLHTRSYPLLRFHFPE